MTKQNEDLEVIEVPNRQGTKIHTLCYKGVSLYQLREAWPDLWPASIPPTCSWIGVSGCG